MYYANYKGTDTILVFQTETERNMFIINEQIVHPNCCAISADEIQIEGKRPVFDSGFGCYAMM